MIIDVSKYQGTIDWKVVKQKNPKIEGVYIKATEGVGYVDPKFEKNATGASAAGLDIGFYHFATLNSPDVLKDSAAEAKAFYNAIKKYKFQMPCVLDIERNDAKVSPENVLKYIQNFVLTMQIYGINDVILYSYTPFLDANLPKNHDLGRILHLWIAAYTPAPKLPNGWGLYYLWQYSSKGRVEGIAGDVDLNKKPGEK